MYVMIVGSQYLVPDPMVTGCVSMEVLSNSGRLMPGPCQTRDPRFGLLVLLRYSLRLQVLT